MNAIAYFEIQASNPKKAKAFYKNVFGWKFFKEGLSPIEYYRIETNGMKGGFLNGRLKPLRRSVARTHLRAL